MKKNYFLTLAVLMIGLLTTTASTAGDSADSFKEAFEKGNISGTLKSYYFTQTFDGSGKDDSYIWTYGGNLKYVTGSLFGVRLGANLQVSAVGYKDDDDNRTAGSMDAEGAVLSEAYLQYKISNTKMKGGRQFISLPLLHGSSSRLIKESFEAYLITNQDIPDTTITAGWVGKYQTRTDKTSYGDAPFVDFENNGDGTPGTFVDIGDGGMYTVYLKNSSLKGLVVQTQYVNVDDSKNGVTGIYADAKYTFPVFLKPYIAAQYYYTDWDPSANDDNDLYGFQSGLSYKNVSLFAGYTSTGGNSGETRVFRGLGQGAYYNYTATTKTAGVGAFEAGTDAYQVGISGVYEGLSGKVRYTNFDNPTANADLEEYTFNLAYKFSGALSGFSVSADFSILDYENNNNDATDLRTRLIYTF